MIKKKATAGAIIGGGAKSKRRDLDYYPTPESATIALKDAIAYIDKNLMYK